MVGSVSLRLFAKFMAMSRICKHSHKTHPRSHFRIDLASLCFWPDGPLPGETHVVPTTNSQPGHEICNGFATVSSVSLRLFAKSMAVSRICRTFTQNTPSDPSPNRSRLALLLARRTSPWRESYGPHSLFLPWPPTL